MAGAALIGHIVGIAGILWATPMILFCLWPGVLRAWFEGGPSDVERLAAPATRAVASVLRQMGFEALGVKVEKTPLRSRGRELAFVSADRRCYASVTSRGTRAHLYYYTPLPGGGLVLTSNGAFPKIATDTVAQRSYPGCEVPALLERHHEALSSCGRRGHVVPTAEARIEATYAYYRTPEVRSVLRRMGLFLLAWVCLLAWLLLR
jgi:hypothetical protein